MPILWLVGHNSVLIQKLSYSIYWLGWSSFAATHQTSYWVLCYLLTHWRRARHICFSKLTIIGSDNGLSPGRRQAIIWTNDGILLIGPLGTNFGEILSKILTFSFKKMHLKTSSATWRPFCLGLNTWTIDKLWMKIFTPLYMLITRH